MRIKRKKNSFMNRTLIVAFSITFFLSMGVCYGEWNENIKVNTEISMGEMNPYFSEVEVIKTEGEGTVQIDCNDHNINIVSGEIGADYVGTINYKIRNKGTMPVCSELGRVNYGNVEFITGSIDIKPKPDNGQYTYSIDKEILFKPENISNTVGYNSWFEKLLISGEVEVNAM
ncbi:hypothetical protein [Clostridium sp. DL1XJH146]